jgi:hypothetical protein
MNRFSKKPQRNQSPFPTVMGTEQEVGMAVRYTDGSINEPYDLALEMYGLLPPRIAALDGMMTNGGKLYIGGTSDHSPTNIEIATPECVDPLQLVVHIRGAQELIRLLAGEYVAKREGADEAVFINHRVVDLRGSRKGVHDNYSYPVGHNSPEFKNALCDLLGARSIASGAGYVEQSGYYFSQKTGGLSAVDAQGYGGTVYRFDREHGDRLEVRCNDVNISDWATWQRVGIVALFLACYAVPETRELLQRGIKIRTDEELIRNIWSMDNALSLDREVRINQNCRKSSALLRDLGNLVLDELPQHVGEIPRGYQHLAQELLRYCDDFDRVLSGDCGVRLLADRADWAAKLVMIQRRLSEVDPNGVSTEEQRVERAVSEDLKYGYVLVRKNSDNKVVFENGRGIRLRARKHFAEPVITEEEVSIACYTAPRETRAWTRAKAIKEGDLAEADWHEVRKPDEKGQAIMLTELSTPRRVQGTY